MAQESTLRVTFLAASLLAASVVGPGFAQGSTLQTDDSASERPAEGAGVTQDEETSATAEASATEMSEDDKIAAALANPLSYLWLLFSQNDSISYNGTALDQIGKRLARAHRPRYSPRHGVPPCWSRRQPALVSHSSARMHPYQIFQQV